MVTSQIKKSISQRLGPIVKYTVTGGFYWDNKLEKFTITETYSYWTWYFTYFIGQAVQLIFALRLFHGLVATEDILDLSENFHHDDQSALLVFIALMYWSMVTALLAIGSINITYREDMIETLNQLFHLDENLNTRIFEGEKLKSENFYRNALINFICYGPLTFPIVFGLSFFHQADPIHNFFEDLLEINVAANSWISWFTVAVYAYGVLAFTGNCISLILIYLLTEFTIQDWLKVTMPTEFVGSFIPLGGSQVSTEKLGTKSESDIIMVYRSLQIISRLTNSWIASAKLAYHSFAMQVIAIVTSFALIRYSGSLLENGSPMGISLILILSAALGLSVFIFYTECHLADGIDDEWKVYKERLLHSAKRNGSIYKVALSFRSVAVMTAHPFCNVNKSTFLEWGNVVVDNLVSLLVSF